MSRARTAFVGGSVWTAGYSAPRDLDVLVEGNRILDVTRSGDLDTDGAELVDTRGRVLIPGFQDAHIHPPAAGATLLSCDLTAARTAEGFFAAVSKYAETLPPDAWVQGGGWDRDLFPMTGPTKEQLDAVTGGRPALLRSYDCHGACANSRAFELAGIDRSTTDPAHGRIIRDGDGAPAGMLEERAVALVADVCPPPSMEFLKKALIAANQTLLSLGVTSVQDAIVGGGLSIPDQLPAYRELLSEGAWHGRVTAALWWDADHGVDQVAQLLESRRLLEDSAGPDRILADTVKVMVDGNQTVFLDQEAVHAATHAAAAAGFSCHYHSYSDVATGWILDAVEKTRQEQGPSAHRHQIAHLMVVAQGDFSRFAELDVTATLQAVWGGSTVYHDMLQLGSCSHDPQLREYAFGRLVAAGARLAAGSDWPVTTPDPLEALRSEAGRGRDRQPTGSVGDPDELDRLDAVALATAYTTGSAYVNGRAGYTGRVVPGFRADLTLLSQDIFAGEQELQGAVVDQTWVDGVREYQRDESN
ncbi:amidohydrolase [Phycicoccus sp. Soil803]|uniref:amidohydrolase n=1 Tax=Phycicoccus sp. Soil803 TaxID=1736415 RepID=UPI00138EC9CE|nr:amidohydrolase family protein [Phycicoccus sp. Soil803]